MAGLVIVAIGILLLVLAPWAGLGFTLVCAAFVVVVGLIVTWIELS